jgi:NAD(P)H-nitrite reductase large subunit
MTGPDKQHLVVIGNGMAGARAVEEILERGGRVRFRITMFGDEPYGNYNRIMLSHVLAGEDSDEIYLNPLDWYAENDITLHAGVRVVRVDSLRASSGSARSTTPPRCSTTPRNGARPSSSAAACSGWRPRTG